MAFAILNPSSKTRYTPTHIHVFTNMRENAPDAYKQEPRFIFFFGYRDVDKTPYSKEQIGDCRRYEYVKCFKIPRIFSEYPLPKASANAYTGEVHYTYLSGDKPLTPEPRRNTFASSYYLIKPGALIPLRGLGIGYYLELIAVSLLTNNQPEPDRLQFRTSYGATEKRRGQLEKVGLKAKTEFLAREWINGLARGVRNRAEEHKKTTKEIGIIYRFVHLFARMVQTPKHKPHTPLISA